MIKSLDKKWKEFLFGFSGFGPNFLMVLMGAYFTDAINPVALGDKPFQAIASGTCFILPLVFPILYAIAKAFDGIIDIPFAHITDTLSTKWGRRRPAIAVCLFPMTLAYAMCWIPIGGANRPLLNTVWIILWALVFFSTYTMAMIAYYGSLSTTCADEPQRLRVSGYKSFFDTISYCLVYALVPLILDGAQIHIDTFVFCCLPLMLTLLIPLFMIKEGEKYGYPENEGILPEKITIGESIRLTFKNKIFMRWLTVNCCTYFGLQMFLVSMNTLILGGMGMNGAEMALLNTCAFAPVPIMLYLFNKLKAKKGIRFTYQTCLIAFALAIMSFFLGSLFVTGGNKPLQYVIGCTGGVMGSWAIGAFFMMPYHVTAQISSVEEKLTKKNHSAMYFAGNAVFTSIVGAISGSFIYETIKNFFVTKSGDFIRAESYAQAAEMLGVAESSVYNFGTLIVPFIVAIVCILGAILASRMPKDYTARAVGEELKALDPSIDLSPLETDPSFQVPEEKTEIIFVQIGLSILSGFIFGFIWIAYLFKSVKELTGKFQKNGLFWALCCFVPFLSPVLMCKAHKALKEKADEMQLNILRKPWYQIQKAVYIVLGIFSVILPINIISLALMQHNVNSIYEAEAKAEEPQKLPANEAATANA